MTISDAAPHNWPHRTSDTRRTGTAPDLLFGVENSVDFAIGSGASPIEAIEQADAVAAMTLPELFEGASNVADLCTTTQAVLTELLDVTARHKAGTELMVRISYDGWHATVSVGDMDCPLPAPTIEPGLYLVRRFAGNNMGQYAGDHGGLVTWAAVSART